MGSGGGSCFMDTAHDWRYGEKDCRKRAASDLALKNLTRPAGNSRGFFSPGTSSRNEELIVASLMTGTMMPVCRPVPVSPHTTTPYPAALTPHEARASAGKITTRREARTRRSMAGILLSECSFIKACSFLAAAAKKTYTQAMDPIEQLRKTITAKRDEMIELQRALTAVPALGPQNGGDGEWQKARLLVSWLERLGLGPVEDVPAPDSHVPKGERPNIIVTIPGAEPQGTFWIMTHMDIAPPGEARLWESDPYTMVVKGDRLIGRGVEDNQQSLVASVFAAACVKELGLRPRRTTRLLFVSDEETGSAQGVQHVLSATKLFSPRGPCPRA